MNKPFDEQALLDRVDGDIEFLGETIEMLEEDCPPLLERLGQAAAARDAEALASSAHALKGMLANFCAEPAEAAARTVEELGRADRVVEIDPAVQALHAETDRLRTALQALLQERKP